MPNMTYYALFLSSALLFLLNGDQVVVQGFVASPIPRTTAGSTTQQAVVRPDASAAVEEALKVTAAFGIESNEAKVAWDIVEELDASDNTQASMGSLNEECEVDATTDDCRDYGRFLDELKILRDTIGTPYQSSSNGKRKSLIDVIKNIKLTPPPNTKTTSSPELLTALEQAKALTAELGVTSPAARLAWESYEEIATAGRAGNAMTVSLAEECAVEAGLEACRGMEELERVMAVLLAVSDNANNKK